VYYLVIHGAVGCYVRCGRWTGCIHLFSWLVLVYVSKLVTSYLAFSFLLGAVADSIVQW
jgi:hypothetical protein